MDIQTGLPENLIGKEPLLEQYKIDSKTGKQSGTRLFHDGTIFTTMKIGLENREDYTWSFFTRLKDVGIHQIEELIRNEFSILKQESLSEPTADNVIIWKSFLDDKSHLIRVASGLYSSLPPVFLKIDDTLNQYIYNMNEDAGKL